VTEGGVPRDVVWRTIAEALRKDLAQGSYRPGDRLPTEAALAARFGVNRHTLRRALADLAAAGLVQPRRGLGVFVTARPTDYRLGRRVRFHQNVSDSGATPSRRFSRLETCPAGPAEAEGLGLPAGAPVHLVEGVSLADGVPLAAFRSAFPAARFPGLLGALADSGRITLALAACGLTDYTRRETRLTAKLADPVLALALQIVPGAPVLRSVAVNVDGAGQVVEFGTTWFAGDRVALTVPADQP
jgi:GntR family phosphonate transport system transcriptional regulator